LTNTNREYIFFFAFLNMDTTTPFSPAPLLPLSSSPPEPQHRVSPRRPWQCSAIRIYTPDSHLNSKRQHPSNDLLNKGNSDPAPPSITNTLLVANVDLIVSTRVAHLPIASASNTKHCAPKHHGDVHPNAVLSFSVYPNKR